MISPRVRFSALAAAVLSLLTLAPSPASAQLQFLGPSTSSGPSADVHDLAFDDKNNVYLHVFYFAGLLRGRFTDMNGVALGQMFNVADRFAGWPSVAYSTTSDVNVFLVTFSTDINGGAGKNIYGRLLRFNNGNPEFIGGMFPISQSSTDPMVQQEPGGVAFNPNTGQFAVSFTAGRDNPGVDNDNFEAMIRLINADGTPASAEANLSNMPRWQGLADVAVDWQTNRIMVVWQGDATARSVGIWGAIVDGATGQPVTGTITLSLGGYSDQPKVKYLPEAGNFLTFFHDNQGSPDVVGRKVSPNGDITSSTYPLVQTPQGDGTPDGAYDWVSRKVLIASQHDSGYLWGGVLNGAGVPEGSFRASQMPPAPNGGTYYPKVVAAANGQFGIGFTLNLSSAWIERWQAPAASEPGPKPGPGGGGGVTPITIDMNAPNGSWLFAEGVANNTFNSYFLIANPNDAPVPVRAFFANEHGVVKKAEFNVPGQSRHTVDLRAVAGDGAYGAVIQSMAPGQDIFVERSVYFGANFEGSTTAAGSKVARANWWFAEGSRGGEYFANYFLILNPNPVAINVRLDYYRDDGNTVIQDVTIPAQTRYTVNAGAVDGLEGRDFSTKVSSAGGEGFVAERAMYWGKPSWYGGTASLGAYGPNIRWYFAEGVGNMPFETVYLLMNPNPNPITVRADYQPEFGSPFSRNYTIEANRRFSIPLNLFEPGIGPVSAVFSSEDGGFVAERSIYWGTNRFEGSNVVGVNAPAGTWYLPEGADGGLFDTYVLIQNPNDNPATVDVELFVEGFGKVTFPATLRPVINAHARLTLDMSYWLWRLEQENQAPIGSLVGRSFSTRVRVFQGPPVVVEHSIYWDYRDQLLLWRSGGAEFGIPQQ